MPQTPNYRRAWKSSLENPDSIQISEDSLQRSVDFCLRAAKKFEDEENYDEAESLYIHSLSMDGSNSGENIHEITND